MLSNAASTLLLLLLTCFRIAASPKLHPEFTSVTSKSPALFTIRFTDQFSGDPTRRARDGGGATVALQHPASDILPHSPSANVWFSITSTPACSDKAVRIVNPLPLYVNAGDDKPIAGGLPGITGCPFTQCAFAGQGIKLAHPGMFTYIQRPRK